MRRLLPLITHYSSWWTDFHTEAVWNDIIFSHPREHNESSEKPNRKRFQHFMSFLVTPAIVATTAAILHLALICPFQHYHLCTHSITVKLVCHLRHSFFSVVVVAFGFYSFAFFLFVFIHLDVVVVVVVAAFFASFSADTVADKRLSWCEQSLCTRRSEISFHLNLFTFLAWWKIVVSFSFRFDRDKMFAVDGKTKWIHSTVFLHIYLCERCCLCVRASHNCLAHAIRPSVFAFGKIVKRTN